MSELEVKPSIPALDESLSNLTNCSSINHNLERTISQDSLNVTLDKESKSNYHQVIRLEIIADLILIAVAILVQLPHNTQIKNSNINYQQVEINHQVTDNR